MGGSKPLFCRCSEFQTTAHLLFRIIHSLVELAPAQRVDVVSFGNVAHAARLHLSRYCDCSTPLRSRTVPLWLLPLYRRITLYYVLLRMRLVTKLHCDNRQSQNGSRSENANSRNPWTKVFVCLLKTLALP